MSKRLLPLVPDGLSVLQVQPAPDGLVIVTTPRPTPVVCPACQGPSYRRHGCYERTLADLPWQGCPVRLRVRVRRLCCTNPTCTRRTFSEPLPTVAAAYARRSLRLGELQRHLGLALGGEAGARLAQRLSIPLSPDTLLRIVRRSPPSAPVTARVIGIDEWAWRRGRTYGTIIVDLEHNSVADLLPDRETASVAGWLRDHPEVEIVARDRAEVYGEGVRQGAPTAVPVADRWHLLRNLSVALQTVVGQHHVAIRSAAHAVLGERINVARAEHAGHVPLTAMQRRSLATQARRHERYEELLHLHAAGASVSGMARALGLDRKTVRRWLCEGGPPSWRKPRRPTLIDPHVADLEQRWSEGCRNAAELARELARRGHDVRPRVVRAWATRRRRAGSDALDATSSEVISQWQPPTINRVAFLLQADRIGLGREDRVFIDALLARAPALVAIATLADRLACLLRQQSSESLDDWLKDAQHTPLARFAAGLQRDLEAVRGAVTTPWSTSPVEGQISRLKMIKRQMYGRAGFDLLRQRVLHTA
jgi:transposase